MFGSPATPCRFAPWQEHGTAVSRRTHAAGAALRLIGGRGTLTTKNPVMTVESYWPYATTLFDVGRHRVDFIRCQGAERLERHRTVAEGNVIDRALQVVSYTRFPVA